MKAIVTGMNNMIDYLRNRADEAGVIGASTRWYPACSLLEDTAAVFYRLRKDHAPGTYLVDSNRSLNFHRIAAALNEMRGSPWTIVPTEDLVLDLRMLDDRINIPSLEERLGVRG